MSRTIKDKPNKLLWSDYRQDYIPCENYSYRLGKTTKPKVRRTKNTEWNWVLNTPSWWNHLRHNKPQRRAGRRWEAEFVNTEIDMWALQEVDAPGVSHKPHVYFY